MRVERFGDFSAIGLGEAGWNALLAMSPHPTPFQSWAFQTTWARRLAEGPLDLYGVQDAAGDWVAVLPLVAEGDPAAPVLRLVGGVEVADYLDLIAVAGREEEAWKALLPVLGRRPWQAVELLPLPAGSATVSLLPALASAAGLGCRLAPIDRCPVIELPDSWEAFLAALPGKDRHELRRKLRRAEGVGARVEVVRSAAGVAAAMDAFLALHRKSKVNKARFMDERMEGFFREVGVALARAGGAALWILWAEERPVAALFCLEYGETVGLYNSGFDPEARPLSPGVVLIGRSLEEAIARGARRYDFLRGDEPYKYGFGASPVDVFRLTLEHS